MTSELSKKVRRLTCRAKAKLGAWFGGFPGRVDTQATVIGNVISQIINSGHDNIAAIGFCWGYKALVKAEGTRGLKAMIGAHPS
jgi:hypothetical protein